MSGWVIEGEDCVVDCAGADASCGSKVCAAKEKVVCAAGGWSGSAESAAERLAPVCALVWALVETARQRAATQRAAENFIRKAPFPPSEMQRNGRQCNASRWTFDLLYGRFGLRASANGSVLSKGRHFVEEEADHEHGVRGDTTPASEVPMRADEFHVGRVGELEDLFNGSLVKALRNFKQLGTEFFPVR